jgi:CPA2 family monovalent cation:H+ antiporter-2
MENLGIGFELFIVLATAIAGGILAKKLRLPVLVGYLAAGVAIGPHGFGLIPDREVIFTIANIGVVLLLFTIGLEFSIKEIRNLGKVALLGGLSQMVITTLINLGISHASGFLSCRQLFSALSSPKAVRQ